MPKVELVRKSSFVYLWLIFFLRDIFRFTLQTKGECRACRKCSDKNEPQYLLAFEIGESDGKIDIVKTLASKVLVDLDCGGECPSKQFLRSESIIDAPSYFVLQLKRFSSSNGISSKLHTVIQHEKILNLGGKVFTLCAAIRHSGLTLGGDGHYKAFVHRFNKWWCCNDMSITSVAESFVLQPSSETYLLFYKRS